jgi:hypothetical protein
MTSENQSLVRDSFAKIEPLTPQAIAAHITRPPQSSAIGPEAPVRREFLEMVKAVAARPVIKRV